MYLEFIWIRWNQRSFGISTHVKISIIVLSFICGLLIISAAMTFYLFPNAPFNTENQSVEFEIQPGNSVGALLRQLHSDHVISFYQSVLFRFYIKSERAERKIQAGEYQFLKNTTPKALLKKWTKGEVILYPVTFPEGITLNTAVKILENHSKVRQENLSFGPESEGLYYPDTYYFPKGTSMGAILNLAKTAMDKKIEKAWEARDPQGILKSPYEALVLASIIEKETAYRAEKAMISGVFHQRLRKKMRLQADPTVIYGLGASYRGVITKENLISPTRYNTYVHTGLPPTPIALPGQDSIDAALHPDNSEMLYFVAKGDGSHHFSATLKEHNQAVKQYQKEKNSCKQEN